MVTLPLAMRRSVEADVVKRDEIVDLRGTTVLLVDDDAATRELVVAMLRRCGADVTAVESVLSACEFLGANQPHIVVTDIAMPQQDGFALLDFVRKGAATARIPVIALTASGPREIEEDRIRNAGFHAWVTKPIDPFQFARVIYNSALNLS
jgi:CheY-like chemotaxis protein